MKLKRLFQYGLMAACLLGNAVAMEENKNDGELLVIGCRPWDSNIQGVNGLDTAHFIDCHLDLYGEPPVLLPSTFHHFDINDNGTSSAGKLSEFATNNPEKFNTIIIDWFTYMHVRRDTAWADFKNLLSLGGKLVIPVTAANEMSNQRAQGIIDNKLTMLFSTCTTCVYEEMSGDIYLSLLRRAGIAECALSFTPAIIFATK